MVLFSESLVTEIFAVIITINLAVYLYFKYVAFGYWSSRSVPFVKPNVPFGNLWPVITGKASLGELFRDKYLEFREHRVFGVYTFHKPALVINDPDLIRIVLAKEFTSFHDRGIYCDEKIDPLSGHLFALCGARWRYLRTKFTPTFTSNKIKQMFFTVKESSEHLIAHLEPRAKACEVVEMKDVMARFATDTIASAAFGIQCNSIDNPDAEFRAWGRKFFTPQPLRNAILVLLPQLARMLNVTANDKDYSKVFIDMLSDIIEYRTANNIVRRDFLDLVMQLMHKGYVQDDRSEQSKKSTDTDAEKITLLEGLAQALAFYIAGFETSSTTATMCLYELALNQDIQDKVAEEINTVLAEFGDLTYDNVNAMPYLHKVVAETMRKHTPVPILNRECTKAFDLPETGLRVDVGTSVVIPVLGIHLDPDHYPDPQKFNPERFSEENIASRHQYAYLPFGEGPRNCIGLRFGLVQVKVGLFSLLSRYRFKPGPDLQIPLPVSKGVLVNTPGVGVTLRVELRRHAGVERTLDTHLTKL